VNDTSSDEATWFNCKAWERQAEILAEHAKKGSMIVADLRYTPRTYTPEGSDRKVTYPEFTISSFRFLGGGEKPENGNTSNAQNQNARGSNRATQAQNKAATATASADDGDDLPF
jgi:single-stranded DNA-binding protein